MALFNLEKKEEKVEEKWIWVDGFKGTDKDMRCHNYQYELGKRHDMPEDVEIEECKSGFHLCLKLEDVYGYYAIKDDHRFFKVRALVREDDAADYGRRTGHFGRRDKLVAKSIEFISECTIDEIFGAFPENELRHWTDADKADAITLGLPAVAKVVGIRTLIGLGYSAPFADFLFEQGMFLMAEAVGSQADLSMDMRVWMIMTAIARRDAERDGIWKLSNSNDLLRRSFNF